MQFGLNAKTQRRRGAKEESDFHLRRDIHRLVTGFCRYEPAPLSFVTALEKARNSFWIQKSNSRPRLWLPADAGVEA